MNKIGVLTAVAVLIAANNAHAANLAVITSPPTIIHLLVLGMAVVCSVGSFKVLESVRGGLLGKSWQFLAMGFVVLALSQLAWLLHTFEIVLLPEFVLPVLFAIMIALFAYGILQAKRTLL